MAEHIDKKEVTEFIDDCLLRDEKLQSVEKETLLAVKRWIDAIPPADVRPVVRCRDCRYSREPDRHSMAENAACEGVLICFVGYDHVYPSISNDIFVDGEHFCGFGEVRDD